MIYTLFLCKYIDKKGNFTDAKYLAKLETTVSAYLGFDVKYEAKNGASFLLFKDASGNIHNVMDCKINIFAWEHNRAEKKQNKLNKQGA